MLCFSIEPSRTGQYSLPARDWRHDPRMMVARSSVIVRTPHLSSSALQATPAVTASSLAVRSLAPISALSIPLVTAASSSSPVVSTWPSLCSPKASSQAVTAALSSSPPNAVFSSAAPLNFTVTTCNPHARAAYSAAATLPTSGSSLLQAVSSYCAAVRAKATYSKDPFPEESAVFNFDKFSRLVKADSVLAADILAATSNPLEASPQPPVTYLSPLVIRPATPDFHRAETAVSPTDSDAHLSDPIAIASSFHTSALPYYSSLLLPTSVFSSVHPVSAVRSTPARRIRAHDHPGVVVDGNHAVDHLHPADVTTSESNIAVKSAAYESPAIAPLEPAHSTASDNNNNSVRNGQQLPVPALAADDPAVLQFRYFLYTRTCTRDHWRI